MNELLEGIEIDLVSESDPLGVVYLIDEILLEFVFSVEYLSTESAVLP